MGVYRRCYYELAQALDNERCFVADLDSPGFCIKEVESVIVINPYLSWQKKLYTLIHEAGHCFKVGFLKNQMWALVKDPINDEHVANQRAFNFLKVFEFEPDEVDDYLVFYKQMVEKKKRRKPWFKLYE
jgi:hypothetical protein